MAGGLTDTSNYHHTLIQNGSNITYDHSNPKFGASALYYPACTTSDWLKIDQYTTELDAVRASEWCWEMWVKATHYGTDIRYLVYLQNGGTDEKAKLEIETDDRLMWWSELRDGGSFHMRTDYTGWLDGNWHHIVIGHTYKVSDNRYQYGQIWIDGVSRHLDYHYYTETGGGGYLSDRRWYMGIDPRSFTKPMNNVYVDSMRFRAGSRDSLGYDIENGSSFTVPSSAYPNDSYTKLLLQFDDINWKISGTLSDDAQIIVMEEYNRSVVYDQSHTAGSYAIYPETGLEKMVMARRANGEMLAYGKVTPKDMNA